MAQRLHIVEQKFLDTIKENNLIEANDIIVVGVSGGPDSATLLSCLNKYKKRLNYKIVVAHVNHLIRKDSTDDKKYVENMCRELEIQCFIKRANVEMLAKENKKSTEEMGRIIRYDFFDEVALKVNANKIAVAHNMNDSAETMLLNLIRGTGLTGLEGIRPLKYNKYIRPLIKCERKEIEEYCKKNNLNPRIDSTNKENIYKRNIIRNKLIPFIEELNPNIIQTLNRTSNIVSENNDFVEKEIEKIYNDMSQTENREVDFAIKKFNTLPKYIRYNLIIKAIKELTGNANNIEKANIDEIIMIAERNIGGKYVNVNAKIKAKIEQRKLKIISK